MRCYRNHPDQAPLLDAVMSQAILGRTMGAAVSKTSSPAGSWRPVLPGKSESRSVNLPSIELLEARHAFPCHFTFKVIGAASENFTARVVSHVRDELQIENDPPYSLRSAKGGKHVSITLEPECESAQQVLAIYSRLMGMEGLLMLL